MKTRIEAFIDRLATGEDALNEISRQLEYVGKHELAKQVYALYIEAYMIHRELEHQRKTLEQTS